MIKSCKGCSKDLNFSNFFKVHGKNYCIVCWNGMLRRMNNNKKLPDGYGKTLKVLETMVKMHLTGKFHIKNKQLRVLAIKRLQKEIPVIFDYML